MAANLGTLLAYLGVDTSDLKRAEMDMTKFTDKTKRKMKESEKSTVSLGSAFKKLAAAVGAYKAAQVAVNAVLEGARFKTLGVVMETVGRNAGYSAEQMQGFAAGVQKTGIAMTDSRLNLTKMAQAQLDLSKSSELARVAQDAAVIGYVDSSEAFGKLIHAIQTGRVAVLQTIGLNVSFGQSYKKMAAELGIATTQLTEGQKATARLNIVLEKGKRIAGAYEAAMDTASKKLGSMVRPAKNLAVAFGEAFDPALGKGIDDVTQSIKDLTEYLKEPENQQSLADTAEAFGLIASSILWFGKVSAKAGDMLDLNIFAQYTEAARASQGFLDSVSGMFTEAAPVDPAIAQKAEEEARKVAEQLAAARKEIEGQAAADQLRTLQGVASKEKEGLTKRIENYTDFYDDLQKKMKDNFQQEKENLQNLNSLYRQQTSLRRSTEGLIESLGGRGPSDAQQFAQTSKELKNQFESALDLEGTGKIEALEAYKQSVAELAEQFKDGFGHREGSQIATQAIRDIETAYRIQKETVEELTDTTQKQIETDKLWGQELAAESVKAATEIKTLQELMVTLDEQIATMDTLVTIDVNDLATSEVHRIEQEIQGIKDKVVTITTRHVTVSGGGGDGGGGSPVVDSLAVGSDFIPKTGLYELHRGEAVIPADKNAAGEKGMSFEINIDARGSNAGEQDWRKIVRDKIIPELKNISRN